MTSPPSPGPVLSDKGRVLFAGTAETLQQDPPPRVDSIRAVGTRGRQGWGQWDVTRAWVVSGHQMDTSRKPSSHSLWFPCWDNIQTWGNVNSAPL